MASDLRWVYFRRAAAVALVMWAALWALGSIKYGPLATVGFVVASLWSVWLGAGMLAERLAATTTHSDVGGAIADESKKAA